MALSRKKRLNKAIGLNIRKARIKKGWSQQYLGDRIGLSRVSINNIEFGRNGDMPVSHVFDFANLLKIKPWLLVKGL